MLHDGATFFIEWGGLIKNYYLPPWDKYFAMLQVHLGNGTEYTDENIPQTHGRVALKANEFYTELDKWEKTWIESRKNLSHQAVGDEIETVKRIFKKYQPHFNEYYK